MLAIIESAADSGIGLLPIAGRPLVIRQLQWLRASGFDRVAVQVPPGQPGAALSACMMDDPLGWDVVQVPCRWPVSAPELARRAGFGDYVPVLALPADVLGSCDLSQVYLTEARCVARQARWTLANLMVQLQPPPFWPATWSEADAGREGTEPGNANAGPTLMLLRGALTGGPEVVVVPEWGARIRCGRDAIAMSAAILEGRAMGPGLVVHAREVSPGIWIARGGHLHPHAHATAPLLIGPGAIVRAGARVGPRAFIGARAIVERRARLEDVIVAEHTIVGEHTQARHAVVTPHGVRDAGPGGRFQPVEDPLVLTRRKEASPSEIPLSLTALAAALSALGLGLLLH